MEKVDDFYLRDRALEIAIKSEVHHIYNDENATFKCDVNKLIESANKIEKYLKDGVKNEKI